MQNFLDNIELWLSGAGLVVILAVPALFGESGMASWQIMAMTAIVVGVLHGSIFWFIRRRQRVERARAIDEIRRMLKDVVNNQLQIALWNLPAVEGHDEREKVAAVTRSLEAVSKALEALSEESLQSWEARYAHVKTQAA